MMFTNGLIAFKTDIMGKLLIIRNADFSENSVAKVRLHYNEIGNVDLSQYQNLRVAITKGTDTNLDVSQELTTCDSYVVPVIKGERYQLKYWSGPYSYAACGLSSEMLEVVDGKCTNIVSDFIYTENEEVNGISTFVIPSGIKSIFICGRNSNREGSEGKYALTLARLS